MGDRRQKVKDLIELACDEGNEDGERTAAAMRAVKLIRKYNLLSSPFDLLDGNNEVVQAAKSIVEALPDFADNARKIVREVGRMRRR